MPPKRFKPLDDSRQDVLVAAPDFSDDEDFLTAYKVTGGFIKT